jgi:replicative DNA helicase
MDHPTPRTLPHRPEAENAVLGGIMLGGREKLLAVLTVINEDDFYRPQAQAVFRAMRILEERGEPIDVITLEAQLRRTGEFDLVGGIEGLMRLDKYATAHNIKAHAELILDAARVRRTVIATREIAEEGMAEVEDVETFCAGAARKVTTAIASKRKGSVVHVRQHMLGVFEGITERQRSAGKLTGVATGFSQLDEMTCGLQPADLIILAARPSMGKAQPLDAKVLTSNGFVEMGDLRVGDELASVDGSSSSVTGVFPQGERQVYRVTFSDGRSTECCGEHLWRVHYRTWPSPRVLTTTTIQGMLTKARYRNRMWVDAFSGEYGRFDDCDIHPWLLGQLIGNGCLLGATPQLSTIDDAVLEHAALILANIGLELRFGGGCDWRLTQTNGGRAAGVCGMIPNPLTVALKRLGLHGCRAPEKFIPEAMFSAVRSVRMDLLAGLLDSDGWVEKTGAVCYGTTSLKLADDVVRLVRSLGGCCAISKKYPSYTYKGEALEGLPFYVCFLSLPEPKTIPMVSARAARLTERKRQRRLNFASVEPSRVVSTQCIAVSHPSRLYITDDYIVTHNTAFALNLAAESCILKQRHAHLDREHRPRQVPVLFFSLEMGAAQLVERVLCSEARVDYQTVRRGGRMMESDFRGLIAAADRISNAPLYIDDTAAPSILDIRERTLRWSDDPSIFPPDEEDQSGLVMIDYLQLARGGKAKYDSREQEISEISRGLKALAKEIRKPVIALSQLNRAVDARADHRPQLSDLRESGAIEQDADVIMFIYREERYLNADAPEERRAAVENKAEIIIGKQRNGPIGTVHLNFIKPQTRFVDPCDEAEMMRYGFR